MNILIAPNSMKGSLNADEFATSVEEGFRSVSPCFKIRKVPVADGGDYTGELLIRALSANRETERVKDPLGRETGAFFGVRGETAVMEMASASGIRLLSAGERDPEAASTYGTGQLMRAALNKGCTRIILGVGGSATIDGGIGMLEALGFSFYDKNGMKIPGTPGSLKFVKEIKAPGIFPPYPEIIVLADVNNPLLGERGTARVFGPQKGAGPDAVARIEAGLRNWAEQLGRISGKNFGDLPGAGAAGGIATGLMALLRARLVSGAGYIFDLLKIDEHIQWADWIITGEGAMDDQSLHMKAPEFLARKAAAMNKPITALTGSWNPSATNSYNGVFSICKGPVSIREAIDNAKSMVSDVSAQIARLLLRSFPGACTAPSHTEKE